ncbi:MAG: hypothetical protein NC548_06360 [Lachnospiraceae bacterium]|nr:hypothetical protein [Lachnospiraceae bacterium]
MAFIPGLDLNTQLEMRASKAALGAFAAGAVGFAGLLGLIPKEFAEVKKPDDIIKVGSGLLLEKLVQMAVQESTPQQNTVASQTTAPASTPPPPVADW